MATAPRSTLLAIDPRDRHAGLDVSIEALQQCDLDGLRTAWPARYGPPPALRSIELFRLVLAFRLQAEMGNGLDGQTRRLLRRRGPVQAEGLGLGVGARLTRDWQGRSIEVVVEADGFRWQDRMYPSLSAAASAIAGSRWNGPRFFGLRRKPS